MNIEEFVLAALEDPRLAHLRPSPSSTARKGQDGRAGCDVLQEEEDSGHGYDIHRIAKGTALLLWEKADMLREYFNIGVENISGQYMLTSLPALLEVSWLCYCLISVPHTYIHTYITLAIRAAAAGASRVSSPTCGRHHLD